MREKCVRVFASTRSQDGGVKKRHATTKKLTKMESSPANCFIDNSDITGKTCPYYLDKEWYIAEAHKRLAGFGIGGD
ncbi:MAG: hypothetical protein IJG85_05025 [Eubacteriaceae bacterium]|nr:hypothetical protein [Eubacteriaceae bacterium]